MSFKVRAVFGVDERRQTICSTTYNFKSQGYAEINDGVHGVLQIGGDLAAHFDLGDHVLVTIEKLPPNGDKHITDAYRPEIQKRKLQDRNGEPTGRKFREG